MVNNNSFQIPLFDSTGNSIGNQNISVSSNSIFSFKVQGEKDNKIEINTQNKELLLNNEKGEFNSISKDELVSIPLSTIKVDYNNNITFTVETENGKKTYKIDSNSVSVKESTTKKFMPICTFNKPLDISLPNNLPEQIQSGKVSMKEFPTQMFDVFQNAYNYKSYTSKDGKLKLLKNNNNELLVANGSKIIKTEGAEYFKNGESSVLGLKLNKGKGIVNNQATRGIGFKVSEEELESISAFVAGEKSNDVTYHSKEDIGTHTIDYSKAQKSKETTKVASFTEPVQENKNEEIKEEPVVNPEPEPEPKAPETEEQNQKAETLNQESQEAKLEPETLNPEAESQNSEPNALTPEAPTPTPAPETDEQNPQNASPNAEPEMPNEISQSQEPTPATQNSAENTNLGKNPSSDDKTSDKKDSDKKDKEKEKPAVSNKLDDNELKLKKSALNGLSLLLFGIAAFFVTGAAFLGAPVLGFVAMLSVFLSLSVKAYASSDAVKTRFFERRNRNKQKENTLQKLLDKQKVADLSKREEKKLAKLLQKEEQKQDKVNMLKPSYEPYKEAKQLAEQNAEQFDKDKYNYIKRLQVGIKTRQQILDRYHNDPNSIKMSIEQVNQLNDEVKALKDFRNEMYNVLDTNKSTNMAIVDTLKMNFENNEFPTVDQDEIVTESFNDIKSRYMLDNNIAKPDLTSTLKDVYEANPNMYLMGNDNSKNKTKDKDNTMDPKEETNEFLL